MPLPQVPGKQIQDNSIDNSKINSTAGIVIGKLLGVAPIIHTHPLADITDDGVLAAKDTVTTTDIDNNAVTYEKIQDVSATDKLLGRSTAGAGVVEEITLTAVGRALIDDADVNAQRTTLGVEIGVNVEAFDAATVKDDEYTIFTQQQVFGAQELTDGAQIAWDGNSQQTAILSTDGGMLLNITSMLSMAVYRLRINLFQASNVVTFDSGYNFVGSVVPGVTNFTHLTCIARGPKIDTIATEDFAT
ncbi:MAG: hypothetical protein ACUZ8H_07065 [Candidatus Anammoxibacter sp.]